MINVLYILIITSISCSLLGVFLILRKLSMLTDAISHTVLLGIVIAFFFVKDLSSPYLIIGATIIGMFTVVIIEVMGKSRFAEQEDAIGIIFPMLFSIAVILISKYFRNVHLGTDIILVGEVLFSSLNKVTIFGYKISKSFLTSSIMLTIIVSFITLFYKELKASTFDPEFSKLIGIPVGIIFYALMVLTSFAAVVSFNIVGAILVISFFIAPSATALIITKKLKYTLLLTCVFSIINCTISYFLAFKLNVSVSGMCAFINMITYIVVMMYNKIVHKNKI